ncbi:MAG: hypothetical protein QXS51_00145 [Thermoproteota archaeon]
MVSSVKNLLCSLVFYSTIIRQAEKEHKDFENTACAAYDMEA